MCLINSVFSVDITQTQELSIASFHDRNLMNGRMRPQNGVCLHIVSVGHATRNMISRYAQRIETVLCRHHWREIIKQLELLTLC